MRVRVKHVDANGGTLPSAKAVGISVPSDNLTLGGLRIKVLETFFPEEQERSKAEDMSLSLNKKDILNGDPSTSLSSLGVRHGDLLYLVSPPVSTNAHCNGGVDNCEPGTKNKFEGTEVKGAPTSMELDHVTDANNKDKQDVQEEAEGSYTSTTLHSEEASAATTVENGTDVPSYLLRVIHHNPSYTTTGVQGVVLNLHAAMLESRFSPVGAEGADAYKLHISSASSTVVTHAYGLRGLEDFVCTVTFSRLGETIVVGACVDAGRAHHVALSPSAYAAPYDRLLWNKLKDDIAFPMVLAVYAAAGLPPPLGLIALPTEIKLAVLQQLPALDLAALGATCTEFRHLSSRDAVWQPLLASDFPLPPQWIIKTGRSCKWQYAQCYKERRRREEEEEERRRRQRHFVMPRAHPYPSPWYPRPAPPGFPAGAIGGDQDRLPFLPGNMPGGFSFGGTGVNRRGGGSTGGRFGLF